MSEDGGPYVEIECRLVGGDGSRSAIRATRADNYFGHHIHQFWCVGACEIVGFEHRCAQVDPRWKYKPFPERSWLIEGDTFSVHHDITMEWEQR